MLQLETLSAEEQLQNHHQLWHFQDPSHQISVSQLSAGDHQVLPMHPLQIVPQHQIKIVHQPQQVQLLQPVSPQQQNFNLVHQLNSQPQVRLLPILQQQQSQIKLVQQHKQVQMLQPQQNPHQVKHALNQMPHGAQQNTLKDGFIEKQQLFVDKNNFQGLGLKISPLSTQQVKVSQNVFQINCRFTLWIAFHLKKQTFWFQLLNFMD